MTHPCTRRNSALGRERTGGRLNDRAEPRRPAAEPKRPDASARTARFRFLRSRNQARPRGAWSATSKRPPVRRPLCQAPSLWVTRSTRPPEAHGAVRSPALHGRANRGSRGMGRKASRPAHVIATQRSAWPPAASSPHCPCLHPAPPNTHTHRAFYSRRGRPRWKGRGRTPLT